RVPSVLRDAACRDVGLRGGLRPGGRGPAAGAVPCPSGLDGRCAGSGARRSLADDLRPDPPGAVLRARLRHDRSPPVRSAAAGAPRRVLRNARPGRAVALARGDRVTTSMTNDPFTPVADALPNLEGAVSPLVGIVTQTLSTTSTTDEACLPNCASELATARRTLGLATVDFGSGAHPEPARARAAAIGEALERYSALFVPEARVRTTTAAALGDAAVRPSRFALFHPTQLADPRFPFVEFGEETPAPFVEGISLEDGSAAFLPAEIVYHGRPETATPPIAYSTSSGLACAPTFTEAVLAALLEVVERDAVMLAWKCGLSLPLLDWGDDDVVRSYDQRYFGITGLPFSVLDGSGFLGVPVSIAVVHGFPTSGASLAVGAGAAATVAEAWLKAVSEGFGVYRWLRQQTLALPAAESPDPDCVETFDEHMLFYARPEQAKLASFL